MKLQLLRNATLWVTISDTTFVVDPMFDPARSRDAVPETPNQQRNPLVDLPAKIEFSQLVNSLDGLVVTHTHTDHWDATARSLLPKSRPLFCQPEDETAISGAGFTHVTAVTEGATWGDLTITRTGGQHGRGRMAELMAPVSGYVISADGEPTLYVAGDTVWCEDVAAAIDEHQPDVIVVNAGAGQFLTGGPITMTAEDVIEVAYAAPDAVIVAVHMEAINHCLLRRDELRGALPADLTDRVLIPEDGEILRF